MQFADSIQLLCLLAAPQSVVTVQEFPEELWGVVVPTCGDAELCIPAESGLGPDCLQLLLAGLALAQPRHKREPLPLSFPLHTSEKAHLLLLCRKSALVANI